MSSYTRSFAQTNGYSYQSFDTNGAVASRWDWRWINQNDVDWSLAQGGTETSADGWAMSWSPQAPPNSYVWDSQTSKVWPASPGTGTQTNVYHSGNWVFAYDLGTYSYTNNYATNGNGDLAQPYYSWVHVDVRMNQSDPGDTNNASYHWLWTNAITETAQARIELRTGGEPGATNVMFYSIWLGVWPAAGGGINPEDIVVAGQSADLSGRIVLPLLPIPAKTSPPRCRLLTRTTLSGFTASIHGPMRSRV